MSTQIQKQKARPEGASVEEIHTETKDSQETNDLLDEIDGVLEENYEQFVDNYEAKGGQ